MNIDALVQDSIATVTPTGSLAYEEIATLRNRLADLVDNGTNYIILDLKGVSYLSSKFLAILIDIKNSVEKKNGDFKLANANPMIKNLFELTRLTAKIEIHDSEESARKAFKKQ